MSVNSHKAVRAKKDDLLVELEAELLACAKALASGKIHRICECDHGIDGMMPLRGELCVFHKIFKQPHVKRLLNEEWKKQHDKT